MQSYKYDSLNRLIEAKEKSGTTQNWIQNVGYDRFGNRTSFNQFIGTQQANQTPTIDPEKNRFTTGQGFTCDFDGNLIADSQGRQFTFNGDNKQTQVKDANNVPIGTYQYDGTGARVKKITASETTIFVYNAGGKLLAEYSTQTASNPTISYLTQDNLGSPRVITDNGGNVSSRRDFLPFGEELNANNATKRLETQKYTYGEDNVRKRFTGYEKDQETGLDFAEARYYNNQHGRFTAVDPLLASGLSSNPQTFNRYAYVSNNPINSTDPTGMWQNDFGGFGTNFSLFDEPYRPISQPIPYQETTTTYTRGHAAQAEHSTATAGHEAAHSVATPTQQTQEQPVVVSPRISIPISNEDEAVAIEQGQSTTIPDPFYTGLPNAVNSSSPVASRAVTTILEGGVVSVGRNAIIIDQVGMIKVTNQNGESFRNPDNIYYIDELVVRDPSLSTARRGILNDVPLNQGDGYLNTEGRATDNFKLVLYEGLGGTRLVSRQILYVVNSKTNERRTVAYNLIIRSNNGTTIQNCNNGCR